MLLDSIAPGEWGPIDPWGVVGPQSDGTVMPSPTAVMSQPQDTSGGQPAGYSQTVLDIFKYGIGTYASLQMAKQQPDYKRYEATNGGLFQQGRPANIAQANTGGASNLMLLAMAGVVIFAIASHKG